MVKYWIPKSELQKEANLGVMKEQSLLYQVDLLRLQGIGTFNTGVKILRTQNLDIHWDQRVYMI